MNENKSTLKPCPFCGHDVIRVGTIQKSHTPAIIYCNLCGANLSSISTDDAIEIWNTRYPDEDGNLRAMSVSERIRRAIDLDFCESGENRKLCIFISKDLFDALQRECVVTAAFSEHEFEIIDGAKRLYLASKI